MNVAILVVQYDILCKKYETDLTYCHNHAKVNNELYISSSPYVKLEIIKFARGSKEIRKLEKLQDEYRRQNNLKR